MMGQPNQCGATLITFVSFTYKLVFHIHMIRQPNQCGATLITFVSFTYKLVFYIHNVGK